MNETYFFHKGLLAIAQDLRMNLNGSSDTLMYNDNTDTSLENHYWYLKKRINEWKPNQSNFDRKVYELILSVIDEYEIKKENSLEVGTPAPAPWKNIKKENCLEVGKTYGKEVLIRIDKMNLEETPSTLEATVISSGKYWGSPWYLPHSHFRDGEKLKLVKDNKYFIIEEPEDRPWFSLSLEGVFSHYRDD